MFKAMILALSFVAVSAQAAVNDPQLFTLECRADNGVTLKTTRSPRLGTEQVTVESRFGLITKNFNAKILTLEDGNTEITLIRDNEIEYSILTKLDLTSDQVQIVNGVLYATPFAKISRFVANVRCNVVLQERLP